MVRFDEEEQQKRLKELRDGEEENLIASLAGSTYGISYIDLTAQSIDNDAIRLLTEDEAKSMEVGPYKLIGKKLFLAVRSPVADGAIKAKSILEAKGFVVTFVMASRKSIEKVWSRYQDLSFATTSRSGGLDIAPDVLKDLSQKIKTTADAISEIELAINEKDAKQHISRILEIILGAGIGIGASDVHIEPMEETVELRFRLDGVLRVITHFDFDTYKHINTRIKLLSGLKLTISSNPQDGRFSAFLPDIGSEKEIEISFRTSLIPGAYGESIVLRILNPKSIHVKLDELGISAPLYTLFTEQIKKPNGMILLTGPTGSGKTTTLYAFLQQIYSPEKKIITIEDPIEYHLPGITQTQTDHKKGYTFLEGLRSSLRQDPDVIMVGEIRDPETAKIAVESALTGHLVFSTLHTNNAQGVIPRLIDLDVNPKILVSALTLSIAQRLVRKLCPSCKEARPVTETEREHINRIWDDAISEGKDMASFGVNKDVQSLWSSKGCNECNDTGYKGRIGIYECIKTDENIEKIITQSPSERDIKKISESQGLLDMKEDGLIKILQGITDFAEVESVVDLIED
ncbi:MAG: type pilus assembly protein PilB [Patescibacteria group bacterium]|jgi:type IV pilus assembly protein PilB|nr:type pilus assembly protein PilB [Patescibacteria group bacterium]